MVGKLEIISSKEYVSLMQKNKKGVHMCIFQEESSTVYIKYSKCPQTKKKLRGSDLAVLSFYWRSK